METIVVELTIKAPTRAFGGLLKAIDRRLSSAESKASSTKSRN